MEDLKEKHLLIRVDANTRIGTGHLMRCLALAQAWKDNGGRVVFITACRNEHLLQRLKDEGFGIHLLANSYPDPSDWEHTKDVLALYPNAWVVLDGYNFDEAYQQQVKEKGHRLLIIEALAKLRHYYADIVLNPTLDAQQPHYSCEPYTRLLLGTRYVLLRREFLVWKDWIREISPIARKILVTMGGSDSENVTLKVIQSLREIDIPESEAVVIMGASNPHKEVLEATAGQIHIPMHLITDATDMPELMANADLAITSGGTTCWEMCFMGLPFLMIVIADNQENNARAMQQAGIAESLGRHDNLNREKITAQLQIMMNSQRLRQPMSRGQRKLVDGLGSQRVLSKMKE